MGAITSRENPKIKQIRLLRQRKQRERLNLFVIEGIRHVGEAAQAAEAGKPYVRLEYIVYSPGLLTSDFAYRLIQEQSARGVPCFELPEDLLASLAEKENPQGLLAVARHHPVSLSELTPENFSWGVALVEPQDPGNIGAILRTVDAVGASGLLLLDNSADPYHPGAVRASMGALFWHPVVHASFEDFTSWAKSQRYEIIGTSAHASTDYRLVQSYRRPSILLMGSEREGLSASQSAICDQMIRLPMEGRVTSLNLAVATGIMLYEMHDKLTG